MYEKTPVTTCMRRHHDVGSSRVEEADVARYAEWSPLKGGCLEARRALLAVRIIPLGIILSGIRDRLERLGESSYPLV
jgi:hypothetical protein